MSASPSKITSSNSSVESSSQLVLSSRAKFAAHFAANGVEGSAVVLQRSSLTPASINKEIPRSRPDITPLEQKMFRAPSSRLFSGAKVGVGRRREIITGIVEKQPQMLRCAQDHKQFFLTFRGASAARLKVVPFYKAGSGEQRNPAIFTAEPSTALIASRSTSLRMTAC